MKKLTIEAQVPEKKDASGKVTQKQLGPVSILVDAPETGEEAITMFGSEAVKTNALANWVVTLQSNIRGGLKKGEDQAAIQARLGSAKMGVAAAGIKVDPKQAFLALFQSSTPAEQERLLADLKAKAVKK